MLQGKCILLGVTGSIAAYKAANLASMLVKAGADVTVLMTENATKFIHPITFETLTGHKCLVDTFDRNFQYSVEHVALAKRADAVLVAPATANVIGKIANGLADDMLTTTVMACTCKKIIAPAMNTNMLQNPIVQENLEKLSFFGYEIAEPATGRLACGDVGAGKLPPEDELFERLLRAVTPHDLEGVSTAEPVDPVRFLSNRSSGKMGCAVARAAMLRGAKVTLVGGRMSVEPPRFVDTVRVETAREMFEAVRARADADVIVKAAAVADYRPKTVFEEKLKKTEGGAVLELERTEDILAYLGAHKRADQVICGFAMETESLLENAREKLRRKNCDLLAANSIREDGAGFGVDTNIVTLLTENEEIPLPLLTKDETADRILDKILEIRKARGL